MIADGPGALVDKVYGEPGDGSASGPTLTHWDLRHLGKARFIAGWSRDPSTKVGAVIVRPNQTTASEGFNGFARGVRDLPERLHDRSTKYALTVHAELNAILTAREPLDGCTLYVWPFQPCAACASAIVQSGILRVIAPRSDSDRWRDSFALAATVLNEGGVDLVLVDV